MLQPAQPSDEISPELMRYLDRDYWEKKEKEKAELKAKALSDSSSLTSGISKNLEGSSKAVILSEPVSTPGKISLNTGRGGGDFYTCPRD